jgi:hypothetical protein
MLRVQITFVLLEEVTPRIFAQKIAQACAYAGALREGEGVIIPPETEQVMLIGPKQPTAAKEIWDRLKPKPRTRRKPKR